MVKIIISIYILIPTTSYLSLFILSSFSRSLHHLIFISFFVDFFLFFFVVHINGIEARTNVGFKVHICVDFHLAFAIFCNRHR